MWNFLCDGEDVCERMRLPNRGFGSGDVPVVALAGWTNQVFGIKGTDRSPRLFTSYSGDVRYFEADERVASSV